MPKQNLKTWALVMDGDHAYVADISSPTDFPVLLYEKFQDPPLTHIHGPDAPGRGFESTHSGTRHAYQKRHDWHTFQKELFAKKAADFLNEPQHQSNKDFDQLIVIAPAKILGILRANFKKEVTTRIIKEMSKDIVHLPLSKLKDYIDTTESDDMFEPSVS